tara:strand:- start:70 stop:306 length:237 start_codon:yes stop_codon:yes gene_type:complete
MKKKLKNLLIVLAFMGVGCQTTPTPLLYDQNKYIPISDIRSLLVTQRATEGITASEFDSGWNQALLNIAHNLEPDKDQ